MRIRFELIRRAVKIETAEEIGQALAIVLIPYDGPLGEKIGGVGIAGAIRHGPREKFAMSVERDGAAGNGGVVDRGSDLERLLCASYGGA